ncbi:beta strand repeat-containing protein [Chryseobacterium sp. CBo1]|uniref:beta strand repeat-containing protein n=1 Tax=Chryseobacterium sp. CBo1 TaxID=1869230 RepID=UPI000F500FD7|nr:hypothetical protein [Chryseobacterium sp. CBo1]
MKKFLLTLCTVLPMLSVFGQSPGGVAAPDFWVKSDDAGNIATAWKDHSANANDIPAVGGWALSPADRTHNFHPYTTGYTASKYFYNDNNSTLHSSTGVGVEANHSIFSVVRPTSATTEGRIIGIDDDTSSAEPGLSITNTGLPNHYEFSRTTTDTDFTTPYTTGAINIFSATTNNPSGIGGGTSAFSGGEKRLGLNGIYQTTTFTGGNRFQLVGKRLRIGQSGWTHGGPFPGDIMEIVWYNRFLTANEQSRVNSYLAMKNGSTLGEDYLTASSAIIWSRTTNTGYNNNIFGIVRDDASALHQKQSTSTNPNQKLIIGNGSGLFDTNALNTNALTNGQFLMVGDNGLKQRLAVPFAYTGGPNGPTNYRFESVWKVQNTNVAGQVTVAWPKGIANMYLLQSSDQTFATVNAYVPMTTEVTVNGVVYNTATVNLDNGQFFTFAGFANAPGGVVNNLSYWYRADINAANTGTGTDVTTWTDFFSGAVVAQMGANALPKFNPGSTDYFNFNPGINFTAGTQTLGNVNVRTFSADSYDVFTFTKEGMTSGGSFSSIFRSLVDNAFLTGGIRRWDGLGIQIDNAMERLSNTGGNTDTGLFTPAGAFSTTIPSIMYNTFTANSTTRALNGDVNFATTTHGGTGIRNLNGGHLFGDSQFGGNGSDNRGFIGNIGETIIYGEGNLTAQERRRIDSYMAIKYGITLERVATDNYLASDAGIVWDGAANSAYNNNIFGIAYDQLSALHQKQSKSVNANQKMIIGAGTSLADTNAANTNSLAAGQYLIVGDNGLRQGLSTSLAYTGTTNGPTNFRFESIWKVQNTLPSSQVTVAWPKGVQNLYLVQSNNETFDTTDVFTPMATEVTINGVIYNTATVTLGNGEFFTFAGFGRAPGGVVNSLSYWYRADKNAANTGVGTDVTTWTDYFSGNVIGQMGTNAFPKYVDGAANYFNFNPGVNFTAGTQTLGTVSVRTFSADSYDVFTFTKEGMTSGGAFSSIFRSLVDNAFLTGGIRRWDGLGIQIDNAMERLSNTGGNTDTGLFTAAGAFSTTIPSIMYNTFTANTTTKALNGSANFATTNHGGTGVRNLNGGHLFGDSQFGGNGSDNRGFIGHLGETIIYGAGNLSAEERRRVDSYMAIKYGITLGQVANQHYLGSTASPTSIVWSGTLNTAYNNNIFGIARADIGGFDQKVSKSVNAGTILTIAKDNDFVSSNLAPARTALPADESYMLLGDNNNTLTPLIDVTVGANTLHRIQRIWLSQRTNTTGSMYFESDLSAYGSTFTAGNTVYMLVADDDAFTTNVSPVTGTFTSGKWVFNYNFDSNPTARYITFAEGIACSGTDSDGDGIADNCDLDDDNDGILDTDECGSANIIERGNFTTLPTTPGFLTPAQFATANPDWVFASTAVGAGNQIFWDNITAPLAFGNGIRFQRDGETQSLTQSITNLYHYDRPQVLISKFAANNGTALANSSTLILSYAGVEYMRIATANGVNTTSTLTYSNGASGSLTTVAVGTIYNNWVIDLPYGVPSTGSLKIDYLAGPADSDDFSLGDIVINACQDTDTDGIPNFLDLDSDNDGCLDAIEGGDNVTSAQLVAAASGLGVGTGSSASNQNLCAGTGCVDAQGVPTVVNSGGAADITGDQGQGAGFSQTTLFNECDTTSGYDCIKPGVAGTPLPTKVGILTKSNPSTLWPQNVPNGHIVLDGAEKGFVITHMTTTERDALVPVEGMMIYNTTVNCVQLYRGTTPSVDSGRTGWNCLETACDGLPQRNVNVGYWGTSGYNFFSNHGTFRNQLQATTNYGPTGTFKGVSGWTWIDANTDVNATAATFTAAQMKAKYDMIVTGYNNMTAASAAKIKEYTDLGGVVFVLADGLQSAGNALNTAFGGTGNISNGSDAQAGGNAQARTLNNSISNGIFGTGGGATIIGTAGQAVPPVANIPAGSFITAYMNFPTVTSTTNAGVYITGASGRAIFVYDEGIYRAGAVGGTVIDTPQEIFIHNLMSYALQKVGFSAQ